MADSQNEFWFVIRALNSGTHICNIESYFMKQRSLKKNKKTLTWTSSSSDIEQTLMKSNWILFLFYLHYNEHVFCYFLKIFFIKILIVNLKYTRLFLTIIYKTWVLDGYKIKALTFEIMFTLNNFEQISLYGKYGVYYFPITFNFIAKYENL